MVAPSPIALTSAGLEDGRDLLLHLDSTSVVVELVWSKHITSILLSAGNQQLLPQIVRGGEELKLPIM